MSTMRVAQIPRPNGAFEIVERPIPEPGTGHVRIRVQACGVCHSDSIVKQGLFPNIPYPRVPGHEVAGVIDAVGPAFPAGCRGSALASAGMAGIADIANNAAAGIFSRANSCRQPASPTTADTAST